MRYVVCCDTSIGSRRGRGAPTPTAARATTTTRAPPATPVPPTSSPRAREAGTARPHPDGGQRDDHDQRPRGHRRPPDELRGVGVGGHLKRDDIAQTKNRAPRPAHPPTVRTI